MPDFAHVHPLAWFLGLAIVIAAMAWLLPVGDAGMDGGTAGDVGLGAAPSVPAGEDLAAFLDSGRWGVSLREVNDRIAAERSGAGGEPGQEQGGRGLNPALKALGYVGLVEVKSGAETILLRAPDDKVVRLKPGDRMPDGRVLAAVGRNSVTLRAGAGEGEEVLALFPRFANEAAAPRVVQ